MYENSFTLIYMYILKEIHCMQFLSYNNVKILGLGLGLGLGLAKPMAPNFWSWATIKSYAGHPGFYRFRALVSLHFFLKHSIVHVVSKNDIL